MNPLGVDKVLILALDKRKDLWIPLETELIKKGWDVEVFVCGDGSDPSLHYSLIDTDEMPPAYKQSIEYPSWWKRNNAYRAWKAHRKMMELSINRGYNSVLFMEDDVVFSESLIRDISPNFPWDMFYLGWFGNLPGNGIHKVNGSVGGWHAVALKKHIMEQLIKFPPIGPFDWICQQMQKNPSSMLNCYAINPPIMRQQGGFSYVEGHMLMRRKEDNYC